MIGSGETGKHQRKVKKVFLRKKGKNLCVRICIVRYFEKRFQTVLSLAGQRGKKVNQKQPVELFDSVSVIDNVKLTL